MEVGRFIDDVREKLGDDTKTQEWNRVNKINQFHGVMRPTHVESRKEK